MIFSRTDYGKTLQRGFTLIELVIVIGTVSLIAGMGLISVRGFSEQRELDTAAKDFYSAAQLTRSKAQSQVKPSSGTCAGPGALTHYGLLVNCQNNLCTTYRVSPVCGSSINQAILQKTIPSNLTVATDPLTGPKYLYFETLTGTVKMIGSNGIIQTMSSPVSFVFRSSSGDTRAVTISPNGNITYVTDGAYFPIVEN